MAQFIDQFSQAHPNIFAVACVLLLLAIVHCYKILRLTREGIRHFLRNLFYAFAAAYLIVVGVAVISDASHSPGSDIVAFIGFVFLIAGANALTKKPVQRKRRVPSRVRATVIARDLGRTKYDPSKHHLDHIWPFSKGGSHTVDNLRVIPKSQNLRKGARHPKWWEIWHQLGF